MRTLSATVLIVLAFTALPAAATTETTTVEDGCGDAYSSVTVDGERTAIEDPLTPHGDIETVTAIATPASLAMTLDMCTDIAPAPENRHGYNLTWDVAPLSAEYVSCDARLALRNHNEVIIGFSPVVEMQGTFEVHCDGPSSDEPVPTFERTSVIDVELIEGEGYVVDGDTLTWQVDATTVGADAMAFLAPAAILTDVEASVSSGLFSAVYVTVPPHGATYGAFGDRLEVGELRIPEEDEGEA